MHTKHRLIAISLLFGIFCLAAGNKEKGFIISFHLEGDETDSERFVTPVKLGSEHRQYFFKKMPSFTNRDIRWFYPFRSQDDQSFGAAFKLNDMKTQELIAITTAHQGKLFGTRVIDAPLRAVIIDRPISDGVVVIWDGLSQNHLQLIGSKIPHIDKVAGSSNAPSLPTFEVNASSPGQQNRGKSNNGGATSRPKKPFKLFGNANRNKPKPEVNPYANPPQPE